MTRSVASKHDAFPNWATHLAVNPEAEHIFQKPSRSSLCSCPRTRPQPNRRRCSSRALLPNGWWRSCLHSRRRLAMNCGSRVLVTWLRVSRLRAVVTVRLGCSPRRQLAAPDPGAVQPVLLQAAARWRALRFVASEAQDDQWLCSKASHAARTPRRALLQAKC